MKNDLKKLRTTFTPLYHDATKKCPAWYAMDARARALFIEIKLRSNRTTENAVGMSAREAAKLLNISDHHVAVRMLRQAVHYGFLVKTADGYLGANGKGMAAEYRLTDEPYLGAPATLDFKRWDGTLFEEKPPPKKTKPCGSNHHRPVVLNTTPCGSNHHRDPKKARKNSKTENHAPVVPITTLLRSSPSKSLHAGRGDHAEPVMPWSTPQIEEVEDDMWE